MRTLLRHYSFPGRTTDAIDNLDTAVSPEIAARVRAAVDPDITQGEALNRRHALGQDFGIFLDAFHERVDATHTLMMARVVFLLKLH